MCGFCLESVAVQAWRADVFDTEHYLSEVNELEKLKAKNAHVFPECVDSENIGDLCALSGEVSTLWIWQRVRQSLRGKPSEVFNAVHWQKTWELFQKAEVGVSATILGNRFPMIARALLSADFDILMSSCNNPSDALLDELEGFCVWVSNEFNEPHLGLDYEDERHEHIAFTTMPVLLFLSAELLLKFRNHSSVLDKIAIYLYPCPDMNSLMMAWQRYVIFELSKTRSFEWILALFGRISLNQSLYLALRYQHEPEKLKAISNAIIQFGVDDDILSHEAAKGYLTELLASKDENNGDEQPR